MENDFEKYLAQNKERFETGAPSSKVWEALETGLRKHHQQQARVIKMRKIWWSAAASVVLCAGISLWLLRPARPSAGVQQYTVIAKRHPAIPNKPRSAPKIRKNKVSDLRSLAANETRESLFYYTKLIELHQKQMSQLQTTDPELYKKSQKAIEDLNTAYLQLKKDLSRSIDQTKVLEAMIGNLQLQEKILNNQLQLIKELEPLNQQGNERSI